MMDEVCSARGCHSGRGGVLFLHATPPRFVGAAAHMLLPPARPPACPPTAPLPPCPLQGRYLNTPELVPFRLTRDVVDGLGVAGVEGVMRRCCEETLRVRGRRRDGVDGSG